MIEADLTLDGLLSFTPPHSHGPVTPTANAVPVSWEDELLSHWEDAQ